MAATWQVGPSYGASPESGKTLFWLAKRTEDPPDRHQPIIPTPLEICFLTSLPVQAENHPENSLWLWIATRRISEPQSPLPLSTQTCQSLPSPTLAVFESSSCIPWAAAKVPWECGASLCSAAGAALPCSLFPPRLFLPVKWAALGRYWWYPTEGVRWALGLISASPLPGYVTQFPNHLFLTCQVWMTMMLACWQWTKLACLFPDHQRYSNSPGLLSQMTVKWLAEFHGNLLSHNSGCQKSESELPAGPRSLTPSRGESLPCFLQLLVAIGIPWLLPTSLQSLSSCRLLCCLCPLLCLCLISLCLFLLKTLVKAFRTHPDDLNSRSLITSVII